MKNVAYESIIENERVLEGLKLTKIEVLVTNMEGWINNVTRIYKKI